jgi:hypothetical protein
MQNLWTAADDVLGPILDFEGNGMLLKDSFIQQHRRDIEKCGVTTLYHQTNAAAAQSIVQSQKFKAGSQGCVGQGMYFAQRPEETYVYEWAASWLAKPEINGIRLRLGSSFETLRYARASCDAVKLAFNSS